MADVDGSEQGRWMEGGRERVGTEGVGGERELQGRMGACLSSEIGNMRVKSWQPLRLHIVYCLPTQWTVNNGTPTLYANCGGDWRRSTQPILFKQTFSPLRIGSKIKFSTTVMLRKNKTLAVHCFHSLNIYLFLLEDCSDP